jgi:tRNA-specific 2-thiouridylase
VEIPGNQTYHSGDMVIPQKKAIALMSGGLDSALAAALVKRLGFEVVGLNLATGFCTGQGRCDTVLAQGAALGIPVRLWDVSEEYLEVVKHPRFGRGRAMNPCLDCRIFMVKKAGELMEKEEASFVVTGEVLGQRPMSQHLGALELVARESGLGERLVRPLSGRLLGPTFPERMGWVRREDWLDLQGRSRKRQLELAKEWGIPTFTQPAGGCCLLLERAYAKRLRDLIREKGVDS